MTDAATLPATGLWRRLAAILYDSLLLFAVLMLATGIWLPFTGGETVQTPLLFPWLLMVSYGFFGWFWTHGGQTLGMKAWRLRAQTFDGGQLTWARALARFAAALLSWLPAGTGFVWQWFDRDGLAWHDRVSGTYLAVLPRRGRTS